MRSAAIFSLLLTTVVVAQHGPRIGLGLATQSVGGLFQNTSDLLAGPIIGWHFEAPVHPQVSVMPEILLMTKGAVVRDPMLGARSRATLRYLEVPILLKIRTDQAADGLYLLGGASVGHFLSGRYQTWLQGERITDARFETGRNIRKIEFSGIAGMGLQGQRMAFDVRAQTSLTPFDRFIRIQNVVYALTVAYRLRAPDDGDR
jgi:hypothetical protein